MEWTWLFIDFLFELDNSLVEKGRVGGQKGNSKSVLEGEKRMEEQACSYIHVPSPERYLGDNYLSATREQKN